MNEIANALAAATLRQIDKNDGRLTKELVAMIKETSYTAAHTDGTCPEVKKLAEILRDYVIRRIENEKEPGLSEQTTELLTILRYGFTGYLRGTKESEKAV